MKKHQVYECDVCRHTNAQNADYKFYEVYMQIYKVDTPKEEQHINAKTYHVCEYCHSKHHMQTWIHDFSLFKMFKRKK